MTLARTRDFFHCSYCATYVFPEPSGDGVRRLGQPADCHCPICDVPLVEAFVARFQVLSCERCEGVLLPLPTFAITLQLRRSARETPPTPPTQPLDLTEAERKVQCPRCGELMEAHPYHGGGAVMIDDCDRCGLVWLDRGEIARIVRST